jgi:hypothetical protein
MEASESAVLDSGKDRIDLESLEKWEDEEIARFNTKICSSQEKTMAN